MLWSAQRMCHRAASSAVLSYLLMIREMQQLTLIVCRSVPCATDRSACQQGLSIELDKDEYREFPRQIADDVTSKDFS